MTKTHIREENKNTNSIRMRFFIELCVFACYTLYKKVKKKKQRKELIKSHSCEYACVIFILKFWLFFFSCNSFLFLLHLMLLLFLLLIHLILFSLNSILSIATFTHVNCRSVVLTV